jgi:hypothetical protein
MRQDHIFVNAFCGQYLLVFLIQDSHLSLTKLGSISVGVSIFKTTVTGTGAALHNQETVVPLLPHE